MPVPPCGLTPAGAGNMWGLPWSSGTSQAHPRRCGEHPSGPGVSSRFDGLTPAGAGNITSTTTTATNCRAHPRRCGEHSDKENVITSPSGSPPQVRGTYSLDWEY